MNVRKRLCDAILAEHLATNRQLAFVTGARQAGKTTTCWNHAHSKALG